MILSMRFKPQGYHLILGKMMIGHVGDQTGSPTNSRPAARGKCMRLQEPMDTPVPCPWSRSFLEARDRTLLAQEPEVWVRGVHQLDEDHRAWVSIFSRIWGGGRRSLFSHFPKNYPLSGCFYAVAKPEAAC